MALRLASGTRRLDLPGCFDFRDLGGYPTVDGHRTRWRRMFRSDGLHRLSRPGEEKVAELGLVSALDLRTPEEVAEQGPAPVQATIYHVSMSDVVLPCGNAGWHVEPAEVSASYYSTLVANAEAVQEILAVLTDPSTFPSVVCCASGVDRTGIATAVLLGLLGVPDEVVVSDYAASREAAVRRIGRLRFEHPSAVRQDLDRYGVGQLGVVPDVMAGFLHLVRMEHGSFAQYAESIDMAGSIPYLRAALLHAG